MPVVYLSAVILVRDIQVSRRFYEDVLGQTVEADFGLNIGFKGGFALWQVDHARSMMQRPAPDPGAALGHDNLELYFETPDLSAEWERLAAAGVRPVHDIIEQPWGQRAFRVYDPDGYIIELGEPMPVVVQRFLDAGLPVEAVAERTSMPLEIV